MGGKVMSKSRKIAAFSVAAIMTLSMAGCSNMGKIMTVDGEDVNAGIYINYMLSEYLNQTNAFSSSTAADYLNQEVENEDGDKVKLKDYLPDYAYDEVLDLVAAGKMFDKLGLKLTDEDNQEIESYVSNYIDNLTEDYLKEQGISRESVTKYFTAEIQKERIFYYYYGIDGENAVKNKDIKNYLSENYIRYKQIAIPRTTAATTTVATSSEDETQATLSAEEQTKASKKADKQASSIASKYLDYAWQNENFDLVIERYDNEFGEPETEATTAPIEDEDVAEDETGEDKEATETTTSELDEPKEVNVHFYDQNGQEYAEGSPQETQKIKSGEKAVRPDDPEVEYYLFDNWYTDTNYTSVFDFEQPITNEDTNVFAHFRTNEIMTSLIDEESASEMDLFIRDEMKIDEPIIYKDDNYYYVIVKYDPARRNDYKVNGANYENIITEMKYDDFEEIFDSFKADLKVKKNEKAFKKYTPSKIEQIHNDYLGL